MNGVHGSPGGPQSAEQQQQLQRQLSQLEELATILYESNGKHDAEKQKAQTMLYSLLSSPEGILQCRFILQHSTSPYALMFASTSLLKLISSFWASLSVKQGVELRNSILSYLATHCTTVPNYVISSLVQVSMRITKLGWRQDPQHSEVTTAISQFLQHSPKHHLIGLQLLEELVHEMDRDGFGLESRSDHRKTAQQFRDLALQQCLTMAMNELKAIPVKAGTLSTATPAELDTLRQHALQLSVACLSFDYIGTASDESEEEQSTIQLPVSWRAMMEEPSTLQLYMETYALMKPPASAIVLEVLVQMASVRRSLFKEDARTLYHQHLARFIHEVLTKHASTLSDPEVYHHFCRLLSRLKSNFTLPEMTTMPGYDEWLQLVATFTINSFKSWDLASNAIHYILQFWSKMVIELPSVRGEIPEQLNTMIHSIIQTFIGTKLDSVHKAVRNEELDEVFEEPALSDQLKQLPILCRFHYTSTVTFIKSRLDPLIDTYKSLITHLTNGSTHTEIIPRVMLLEGQFAVCMFIMGAIIGCERNNPSISPDEAEQLDAELSARCFQLLPILDYRLSSSPSPSIPPSKHCALAMIYVMNEFRRRFVGQGVGRRMLSSHYPHADIKTEDVIYTRMTPLLGPTTQTGILNSMLNQILLNLKIFSQERQVVSASIELLEQLSTGYTTSHLMAQLDAVKHLISHHSLDLFPFLKLAGNGKLGQAFYLILTRLAIRGSNMDAFDKYMLPFEQQFAWLQSQSANFRSDPVCHAGIHLCHYLTGVCGATNGPSTYVPFFEWLHPTYTPIIHRLIETWWDNPDVSTSVLKFFSELVHNKGSRINFGSMSANGILLFREASKVLQIYGKRIVTIQHTNSENIYKQKLKGITYCLKILARALSGNYTNFGVFALYKDPALQSAIATVLQLLMSIKLHDLFAFPKVVKTYFACMDVLFRDHVELLSDMDIKIFTALFSSLHEGLQGYDLQCTAWAAAALDHIFTWYFQAGKKKEPPAALKPLHRMLTSTKITTLTQEILFTLFNLYMWELPIESSYCLTRSIFSLIVTHKECLGLYQQRLAAAQTTPEAQQTLVTAFTQLMSGVEPHLEPANRDKFTSNLTEFRSTVTRHCVRF